MNQPNISAGDATPENLIEIVSKFQTKPPRSIRVIALDLETEKVFSGNLHAISIEDKLIDNELFPHLKLQINTLNMSCSFPIDTLENISITNRTSEIVDIDFYINENEVTQKQLCITVIS